MSIAYEVVWEGESTPFESFDLGGGAWGGLKGRGPAFSDEVPLDLSLHRDDREAFAEHVLEVWRSGFVDDDDGKYLKEVGRKLWDWCTVRKWNVRLRSDYDYSESLNTSTYVVTGSRFQP